MKNERPIKFRGWIPSQKLMDFNDIFIRASGNPVIYEGKENTEVILMQFTGLKDRKGTEIFEGDIVKNSGTYEVKYLTTGFSPFAYDEFGDEGYSFADCEIIGNIYENPELLEG